MKAIEENRGEPCRVPPKVIISGGIKTFPFENPSPNLDQVPGNYEEARYLIITRSWSLLTREQRSKARAIFETHYRRNLYPTELLYLAVNEEG